MPADLPTRKTRTRTGTYRLSNTSGLSIEVNANGSIRRMDCHGVMINLFVGNEMEGGPANIYLRRHTTAGIETVPLLGPRAPCTLRAGTGAVEWQGEWAGLRLQVRLAIAGSAPAWFWHVHVQNTTPEEQKFDLIYVQDVGLSTYAAIRLNEHYVSHYIDLTPMHHDVHGDLLAARQNLAVDGRHPWTVIGSLRRGDSYATDALQTHGLAPRAGGAAQGIMQGLPGTRLQHEHALIAIQDAPLTVAAGACADLGFFGHVAADHAGATDNSDRQFVDATLALPEATPLAASAIVANHHGVRSLFSTAPMLATLELTGPALDQLFGARRHEEHAEGALLSFFCGDDRHVVLREKELRVQRPHGHILRTGTHLTPDETALTSTVWMAGTFQSMVTQGHVSINRFLSTAHSWLGLFHSHGQRVFVQLDGNWQLLGVPSAFEIAPTACRWIYRHRGGVIEVRSEACKDVPVLSLRVRVLEGAPVRLLVAHHVALGGDDGSNTLPIVARDGSGGVMIGVPAGSDLAKRFPQGGFVIAPEAGTCFEKTGGDELLFEDRTGHGQPFVCVASSEVTSFALRLEGRLVRGAPLTAGPVVVPVLTPPPHSLLARDVSRLNDILPWYLHNALVHFLAPRGLEQYSGGGWGTRDICQGPLEMLLAAGRMAPVRDLLVRVFSAQNADGDWPQWFTFFERERSLRAGDSHGDIVYWPLLALARYLLASDDAALLDESLPFFTPADGVSEHATVWRHVERALAVIAARRIEGTRLASYGHGDWNDSLQPADPALRDHLCSAWTVTLHHQVLDTLARALRRTSRAAMADVLNTDAAAVRSDFQRLLIVDGVVTGYALFQPGIAPQMLLHPTDEVTGVHYSLLPMIHAILEGMFSPAQAREHLALIERHLTGPDGARLFDRPMPYRGGPQRLFQRAESSAFFGREIGLMYTHAHLRYAEALAHVGDAGRLFDALCKAHPLGLQAHVPSASLRQANCYFSSSDAAFTDRYRASHEYARVAEGTVALDGGWRIYSSGPGIALGIVVGRFLGIRQEAATLVIDPVISPALDGLRARLPIDGIATEILYKIGSSGFGPTRIMFTGHELTFQRGSNPYRVGAAELPIAELHSRRQAGDDLLVVQIG